jgi:hypothetical protein
MAVPTLLIDVENNIVVYGLAKVGFNQAAPILSNFLPAGWGTAAAFSADNQGRLVFVPRPGAVAPPPTIAPIMAQSVIDAINANAACLSDSRDRAKAWLRSWRKAREESTIQYGGHVWQSDRDSVNALMVKMFGAMIVEHAAPGTWNGSFRAADNTDVSLTYSGELSITGLWGALEANVELIFSDVQAAKAALRNASSIEQIDVVLTSAGRR